MRGPVLAVFVLVTSLIYPSHAEAAPLYKFTSHTFTSCGASGRYGPTLNQCKAAYEKTSWARNTNFFNMYGGIESWTAPATGVYEITAAGAVGTGEGQTKGLGAIIRANVTLTKGQTYKILIGQAGSNSPGATAGGSGGGGGGTFFTTATNSPIIIAGGGGGATQGIGSALTANGQTTTSGSASSDSVGTAGTSGNAGGSTVWSGGGAGLLGDGTQPTESRVPTWYPGFSRAFVNGGAGGPTSWNSVGGFGGGGGTHGSTGGGGGGGGYSGGGGGPNINSGHNGGGGGSFVMAGATNIATSNGSYAGSSSGITNLGIYNGTYGSSSLAPGYLTIRYTELVSIQVSSVSGGNVASFRTQFQIRATIGQAGGYVTFYAQDKVIGNCKSLYTATTTVTCNWMPSIKGSININALLVPSSDALGATSTYINILVGKRNTLR